MSRHYIEPSPPGGSISLDPERKFKIALRWLWAAGVFVAVSGFGMGIWLQATRDQISHLQEDAKVARDELATQARTFEQWQNEERRQFEQLREQLDELRARTPRQSYDYQGPESDPSATSHASKFHPLPVN